MRKKHLTYAISGDLPTLTRCGKYIDDWEYQITNDTPKAQQCGSCVAFIEAAKRRRMYGKRGFRV